MTSLDYILSCSNLPFDLGSLEPEADALFAACPFMKRLAAAKTHEQTVIAGDAVAAWIASNWRAVLPVLSARFSARQQWARETLAADSAFHSLEQIKSR